MNDLVLEITANLNSGADSAVLERVLNQVLAHFHSETGTIHVLDREKGLLHLKAQIGLPPALIEVVSVIPVGKGIAGQAAATGEPVTMCNLQTDTSGVAKPGARQTGVGGTLCVPMRDGAVIVGTLGIGTRREYTYTSDETQLLIEIGALIGGRVQAASA
jgi:L-methionine (R)-S-oxide reductase